MSEALHRAVDDDWHEAAELLLKATIEGSGRLRLSGGLDVNHVSRIGNPALHGVQSEVRAALRHAQAACVWLPLGETWPA